MFALALLALSLPVLAWTGYLAVLAVLSGRLVPPARPLPPRLHFDVIVPAHNEEAGIAETVRSLRAVDYPEELRRVIVVADNCSDATAKRAADAGALVLERKDDTRRGKGYALEYAFARSLEDGLAQAVVVIDADTVVSENLLHAYAARFVGGAQAVQAEYCVSNRTASWRTRLMHIAFTLFHGVRSNARERLGVSAGLRGNGMAFGLSLLREVPHDAFSVVEDVEYGIRLGRAGHRVHYAAEAQVFGAMVSSEQASRSQRHRWESGRTALARTHAGPLLIQGLRRRSLLLLDLAADLLVPPLTYVALATIVGLALSVVAVLWGHANPYALWPWAACATFLGLYIVRGAWMSGVGPRAVLDLMWAPVYMIWKVILALRPSPSKGQWIRTERERKP